MKRAMTLEIKVLTHDGAPRAAKPSAGDIWIFGLHVFELLTDETIFRCL